MSTNNVSFKNSKTNVIILLASIFTATVWLIGTHINVYQNAFLGAIFELLWLPIILLLIVIPITAIYFLAKDKFNFKSYNYYALALLLLAILITVL